MHILIFTFKGKGGKMKEFVLNNNEYFSKLICLNHNYQL